MKTGYKEGDYVAIATIPFFFRSIKRGNIIVFKHPVYGTMAKRIQHIDPQAGGVFVVGAYPRAGLLAEFSGFIPNIALTLHYVPSIPCCTAKET